MNGLDNATENVIVRMKELEIYRNEAIVNSRTLIRSTKVVIHSIHLGNLDKNALNEMISLKEKMMSASRDIEITHSNVIEDALMEYCEAMLLIATINGDAVPTHMELKVSPQSWAMGLCDMLGELRRVLLTRLMNSDFDGALKIFDKMGAVADSIMLFDIPDALIPLRRKQDIARGIMEKTRSDVVLAKLTMM